MIHYLKADLFKIHREKKLVTSLVILFLLSLLSAFLFSDDKSIKSTVSIMQLLAQIMPLFFIVPTNIFLGEDFTYRTINNIVIKRQERYPLFIYKVISTIIFNHAYVALAYISASLCRILLGGKMDISLVINAFIQQVPLITCISLLGITLFIFFKKTTQAYLTYILLSLLFDNICQLILLNIIHFSIPNDYFLFLSLQNIGGIRTLTIGMSILFSIIYLLFSYSLFKNKELK